MDFKKKIVTHKRRHAAQIIYVFKKHKSVIFATWRSFDMQNKKIQTGLGIILSLLLLFSLAAGVFDIVIPDSISAFSGDAPPEYFFTSLSVSDEVFSDDSTLLTEEDSFIASSTRMQAKLFDILPLKNVDVNYYKNIKLYPGGMPFGVKFFTEGVLVVGFSDVVTKNGKINPAYDAGLRTKDVITKIDGKKIESLDTLISAIETGGGKDLTITYLRDGKEYSTTVKPALSSEENKYKTGMWIRDSGAGIGTVTFIDPRTCEFAGLGHGICDVDTGELMPISRGSVMNVTINGISKGISGTPGELKGYFGADKIGTLQGNTDCGVFGAFSSLPENIPEDALPIALSDEITTGPAYIWCTLSNNKVCKYSVEITAINKRASDTKNFSVKVTDPALIAESGGIVQGMSGSPIIQNGKIIGAVTHVLINDPTSGYGIFIENMLEAAN